LTDYSFLKTNILIPSILQSLEREIITSTESKILLRTVEEQVLKASHLGDIFKGKLPQEISRNISRLKRKKMLVPEKEGTRKYILRFDNNYLLRAIIRSLSLNGFLPENE
jgi:hypothetical protein